MTAWINFKELREKLDFEQVLQHYGVEIKSKGDQHHGYCPLPNHNGKRNSPSFSANLKRGIFQCFGCGAKGNAIDFAVLMEKLNPDSGSDVRQAALVLQEMFNLVPAKAPAKVKRPAQPKLWEQPEEVAAEKPGPQVVINAPLDFELKRLEANHPYLDKRGFTPEIIAHFGLGFCSKGLLAGRIAIPIHDTDGKLVGYCGRLADGSRVGEDHPKYKFPPKREHNGVLYEFHKLKLVYNSHRVQWPAEDLLVVEGFPSVWWLTQMGFPSVVALMGSTCSEEQAQIITELVAPAGRVWIIPDGDEAGERCALSVLSRIAPARFIKWLMLDAEKQPTDYPGGWFRERLGK